MDVRELAGADLREAVELDQWVMSLPDGLDTIAKSWCSSGARMRAPAERCMHRSGPWRMRHGQANIYSA